MDTIASSLTATTVGGAAARPATAGAAPPAAAPGQTTAPTTAPVAPAARRRGIPSAYLRRVEIIVHNVSVIPTSTFNPNIFVVLWKALSRGSYITQLGQTEIEFGQADATFVHPNNR